MAETVTIARRYVGPPNSANGGYACGVAAGLLGQGSAEVTLRRPVPVGHELQVHRDDGRLGLYDRQDLVVEARSAPVEVERPTPVSWDTAGRAAEQFDVDAYQAVHPFPTCFTCGPARVDGDGLRIFPAAVEHDQPVVAWPWRPDPSLAGVSSELVDPAAAWAALDCPSGAARFILAGDETDGVLGRITAAVRRQPSVGERLVVAGWTVAAQGRKRFSGSAVWSADGEVVAEALAVWITLDEEQRAAFATAAREGS